MFQTLLEHCIGSVFMRVRKLASSAIVSLMDSVKWVLSHLRQRPRLPNQDIEDGFPMESFGDQDINSRLSTESGDLPVLLLNIPLHHDSISYGRSLKWLIETSADPDVFLASTSLVPDSDAFLFFDISAINIQLRDAFMSCFDSHDQCIPDSYDKAIVCGLALAHMYWRRYLLPYDDSMCLPGEYVSDFPDRLLWMSPEWEAFERRWRYLETKDPNFLLTSQTGIGWRMGALHVGKDLDLTSCSNGFITPILRNLSNSFCFAQSKGRIVALEGLATNILSKLLHHHSSPTLSTQVLANCTFLVFCMLGVRFTNTDVVNTNKR